MYKNPTVIFLLTVLSVSLVFSGCRRKDPPPPPQNFSGIELVYYKVYDDEDAIEPIISQYVADHPGLTITYRKFDDFSEYQNVILNELAEGEGPDIFSMPNTWFTSNYKKLTPLPSDMGSVSDFESTFVDVAREDLIRPDQAGIEQIYALPMTVDTLALFYNNDHFEDRLPAQGRPSTTWDGILEDVAALKKEDNSFSRFEVAGLAMGRADNITRGVDILYLLFLQYGVNFYNGNMSEAVFAGAQGASSQFLAQEALDFYLSFADPNQKHYTWNEFVASDNNDVQEIEAFARGEVSMVIGYSFMYQDIVNQIGVLGSQGEQVIDVDAIRTASIPQIEDPAVSTDKRVAYASYFAETVSRNTEHPDIAWDFLVFLTNRQNLDFYFDQLSKPTSRRDMIEEQRADPIYGVFANQIGYAESFPIVDFFRYDELFSEVISIGNEGGNYVNALRGVQDSITDLLPPEGVLTPKLDIDAQEVPSSGQ